MRLPKIFELILVISTLLVFSTILSSESTASFYLIKCPTKDDEKLDIFRFKLDMLPPTILVSSTYPASIKTAFDNYKYQNEERITINANFWTHKNP